MDGRLLGDAGFDGAGNRQRRGTRGNVFLLRSQSLTTRPSGMISGSPAEAVGIGARPGLPPSRSFTSGAIFRGVGIFSLNAGGGDRFQRLGAGVSSFNHGVDSNGRLSSGSFRYRETPRSVYPPRARPRTPQSGIQHDLPVPPSALYPKGRATGVLVCRVSVMPTPFTEASVSVGAAAVAAAAGGWRRQTPLEAGEQNASLQRAA